MKSTGDKTKIMIENVLTTVLSPSEILGKTSGHGLGGAIKVCGFSIFPASKEILY